MNIMISNRTIGMEDKYIGDDEPAFIIAEIGINHNGDAELAHKMIDVVADCGCDSVKFQTFSAEEFCNSSNEMYEYESGGEVVRESMLEMFSRLELKREEFKSLFEHARQRGLIPLSTPTDFDAVDLLDKLDVSAFKIGSDDLVYTQLLTYVASKRKPVIISTGMAELEDIDRAVKTLSEGGNRDLVILHCVSLYPTPENEVNLRRLKTLKKLYPQAQIGFSDHSWGIRAAIAAVAIGAKIIEKHFTLDNNFFGPDHRFSANPTQLNELVKEVKHIESQLGLGEFIISEAEKEMAQLCRRSIYARRSLKKGHILKADDFVYRRPGNGMMPYQYNLLVNRRLKISLSEGELLSVNQLESE